MGRDFPPIYGKSKFYEEKLSDTIAEIARLEEVKKACEDELAKTNDEEI